ncbi:MAG: hypothetical protein D8M59_05605 [Planctomycetes bacterium]|nr:hypothetical protein [Planctomycetota bacterium]NOG55944.1 hypothetical protein [Planctomycetota bacterium]
MARWLGRIRGILTRNHQPIEVTVDSACDEADSDGASQFDQAASLRQEAAAGAVAVLDDNADAVADGFDGLHEDDEFAPADDGLVGDGDSDDSTTSLSTIEADEDSAMPSATGNGQALGQVVHLIERIESHLDDQAERSDRMVTLLESAFGGSDGPSVLREIRDSSENLAGTLREHVEDQKQRDAGMMEVFGDLSRTSGKQTEVLAGIHSQLEANKARDAEVIATLGDFRSAMTELAGTNTKSIDVLTRMTETQQHTQDELTGILQRHYRMIMMFAGLCLAVSGTGLVLAIMAIMRAGGG